MSCGEVMAFGRARIVVEKHFECSERGDASGRDESERHNVRAR